MKIAVTYDNGNIFQHFGKTENFKVYEVEDNQVVSSEVIGSNGTGHGAPRSSRRMVRATAHWQAFFPSRAWMF